MTNDILQQNILHFWRAVVTVISAFTLCDHNAIICLVDSKQYGAVGYSFTKALRQRGAFSFCNGQSVTHGCFPPCDGLTNAAKGELIQLSAGG
ncbi:TPA: hypothetical protein ACHI8G_004839, partial [Escherichia coli]